MRTHSVDIVSTYYQRHQLKPLLGRVKQITIADYQMIDVLNDHLCYVVTDRKIPWHLPYHRDFMLVTKVVITHLAKSKCKLAIYTKVEWSKPRTYAQSTIISLPPLLKHIVNFKQVS